MASSFIAHLYVTTTLASPVVIRSPEKLEFDYVIVGSGPGGSVMANRLTELVGVSVAIIEAGTWADESVGNLTTVPAYDGAFLLKSLNQKPSAVDWGFVTTPQLVSHFPSPEIPYGKPLKADCTGRQQSDHPLSKR
jgi:choline dehydrogenase